MIGRTLALYFAGRFTKMVLAMFVLSFLLIASITFVDLFARAANEMGSLKLALVALFRVPSVSEDTLPFAMLFGSIAAFVVANRRLEVVVARAAGVSAWQFLLPACAVGLIFGVIATTLYSPLAANLLASSNELRSAGYSSATPPDPNGPTGPVWLRQSGGGRDSIIGASQSTGQGMKLSGVTAFVFDPSGPFRERVDAPTADYVDGEWLFQNATVTAPKESPRQQAVYRLATTLSPEQVRQTFEDLETIPFWALPKLIAAARVGGLPTNAYELRYHSLLSQPILLLAMVLIAAIVSLRFSRSRDLGRMILVGVAMGFMLYVVTKIARDLGSGGMVPPPVAAWLPAFVAILIGITVLLHMEDG
jgi:lipopolysaccharide export system permease protein